ncbi:Spo0E family sporulation regulatory protein-aspartic acid phosphatase [Cohnella soli]|uniref:Spo0E family sporulation regulatory protein-aspartic acid phosphatase n=1 Tax=Cohnella soli TaxID=425005 RepID=A0ABW0HQH0_9BACL
MQRRANIRRAIERKRREMHSLSDRYGITSEKVLRKSEELDHLLNTYGQGESVKKN